MEVTIQKMNKEDWGVMQKLNAEVFEHDNKHIADLDMQWPFSEIGIAYYKKVASGGNEYVGFVAELGMVTVGYIALHKKTVSYRTSPSVEIENMGVSSEYRSQGIGTQLLQEAEIWARGENFGRLHVSAFARNTHAIDFYKKFGFLEVSVDLEKDF